MKTVDEILGEIEKRAERSDRHACDLASVKKNWEMSVPPQPDDSDMQFVKLSREDVPALVKALRLAESMYKTSVSGEIDREEVMNAYHAAILKLLNGEGEE